MNIGNWEVEEDLNGVRKRPLRSIAWRWNGYDTWTVGLGVLMEL